MGIEAHMYAYSQLFTIPPFERVVPLHPLTLDVPICILLHHALDFRVGHNNGDRGKGKVGD